MSTSPDRLGSELFSRPRLASDERAARVEHLFDIPLLVAALLVIPLLVIEESPAGRTLRNLAAALNWTIWIAFVSELVVMLLVSPRPWRWLRRNPLDAAIVLLTPPLLPAGLQALRLFRLLRLLRLALVVKQSRRLFSPDGVKFAALVAGAAALGGAAIFADVEHRYSLWDGIWWAVSTMATIGGGNVVPHTVIGRIVGMVLMPIGIGFFALLTGATAHYFLGQPRGPRETASADADNDQLLREMRRLDERLEQIEATLRKRDGTPRQTRHVAPRVRPPR
jgi:voltage-gated potassium channel